MWISEDYLIYGWNEFGNIPISVLISYVREQRIRKQQYSLPTIACEQYSIITNSLLLDAKFFETGGDNVPHTTMSHLKQLSLKAAST